MSESSNGLLNQASPLAGGGHAGEIRVPRCAGSVEATRGTDVHESHRAAILHTQSISILCICRMAHVRSGSDG